jgi:hypothetical protein
LKSFNTEDAEVWDNLYFITENTEDLVVSPSAPEREGENALVKGFLCVLG